MDIATTLEKQADLKGEWNGEAFSFSVKVNSMTPQFLQAYKDIDDKPIGLASALSGTITAWDIDLNGQPFPPTEGNLAACPAPFLFYLVGKVSEVWSGNEKPPEE